MFSKEKPSILFQHFICFSCQWTLPVFASCKLYQFVVFLSAVHGLDCLFVAVACENDLGGAGVAVTCVACLGALVNATGQDFVACLLAGGKVGAALQSSFGLSTRTSP